MAITSKILRNAVCLKPWKHLITNSQIRVQCFRKFHRTSVKYVKMFLENENKFAYTVMQKNGYVIDLESIKEEPSSLSDEGFQKILVTDWLKEKPQNIFKIFLSLGIYCSKHNICISDKRFDNLVDILTDSVKFATDEELKLLFYALSKWPETESIRTRNYIEVWASIDDECLNRINKWSYDEMLSILSLFYMLNVIRVTDFSYKSLLKLAFKAKHLTKNQLVKTLFFIGTARKAPHDIHNLQIKVEECFPEFDIDELAIIAMGLFKSKTPIRSMSLVVKIIDKIIEESSKINEVSLAALLKIIKYSLKISEDNKLYDMLTCLQKEIPRLSIMCNVHLALVGTSTLTFHENCLNVIADTLVDSLSSARMKDLERLVLTYGIFNFIPKTKSFFPKIIEELKNPHREEEIKKHGRAFSCCVAYLGLLGMYPADLMNKILSPNFLQDSYGKHCQQYGREILTIHNTAKIFVKDKTINLLTDKQAIALAKKYTDFVPDENYPKQYNATEKMFLDVMKVLRKSRGGMEYVTGYHILPHHQRGDIIICNNPKNIPVAVDKAFSETEFGLLSRPIDNNIWIAFIIAGRNSVINSGLPSGHFSSKVRELNTLGFHAAIVNWNEYNKLEKQSDKTLYLNNLLKEALKKKL